MPDSAPSSPEADLLILGGGLVGLTLAIALDVHGLTSIVVDTAEPATVLAAGFDGRVSAIAAAPWRMLGAIGVDLEGKACPIDRIAVSDGLAGMLHFDADPEEGPLGQMVENRDLRAALHARARAAAGVTLLMPARPAEVVRDAAGVRVTLGDGRVARAPADRRGGPRFADARGRRPQRGALEL